MLFFAFLSMVFISLAALGVTASPAPIPAPEANPIPPELQPIVAAKNNLAGTAAYDDPKFNSTSSSYSNAVPKLQTSMTYITAASLTAGTILVSFI